MKKHALLTIMLLIMTTFIGFGIIIPIMPTVVSPIHLSIMLAVYSAASFIMSPFWGALSDRKGRKPVILIGIAGYSVSFLLFGIADHLVWMYASRILAGLFSGAVMASAVAYVADVTTEEDRTKGMGLVGMSIGFGFIIGPGVGGLLSFWGERVPFFASSILALILFFVVYMKLQESLPAGQRKIQEGQASRWTAFVGRMKYLYVLGFVITFTLAGLETILQYFLGRAIGISTFQMSMMLVISGFVGAMIQGGVVRRMVKRGSEAKFIRVGLILSAAGFILLLFSSNLVTATIYLATFSIGNALARPCITSLISLKTPVNQGVASGLSSSMDSLGRIVGPLVAGLLYNYVDPNMPLIVGAVISVFALVLIYRFSVLDKLQDRDMKSSV